MSDVGSMIALMETNILNAFSVNRKTAKFIFFFFTRTTIEQKKKRIEKYLERDLKKGFM